MIIKGISIVVVVSIITLGILTYTGSLEEEKRDLIEQHYVEAAELVHSGELSEAMDVYDEIIRLDYSEENAWYAKGNLINQLDNCRTAYVHYAEYLKVFPDSTRALDGFEEANKCRLNVPNQNNELEGN